MPTRQFASAAVEDLCAFLETNLPAQIVAVAALEGVAMPAVDVFRRAVHPFSTEKLAVEVECESGRAEDLVLPYWFYSCLVHVVMRGADADIIGSQQQLRRYLTPVLLTLAADPTAGNKMADAMPGEFEIATIGAEGQLLFVLSIQVTVKRAE